jgi:2-oxoglutarate dehydrogenase E2 component (dihydrolipoamide succinyltransferase)
MAIEIKVPQAGESVTEADIAAWLKEDGDYIESGDIVCELETDKANMELPADGSGILRIKVEEGETVAVGTVIATLEEGEKPKGTNSKVEKPSGSSDSNTKSDSMIPDVGTQAPTKTVQHASPAASKILNEKGIDVTNIKGTGKDGRVTKEDALGAQKTSATQKSVPSKVESAPTAMIGGSREIKIEKMSRMRKTIAKKLTEAKNSTAMLTTFNEVDMKPLMDMRKKYQDQFVKKHGIKLGFMSLFTKACTIAMKNHPLVNAQIDGDNLHIPQYVDMGIAVSSEKGLVVPVVRNAEDMSFADIEKEISRLAAKAREGKITIDEMSGGTFTITNGGVFGSMLSTPIINIPQSAILGMHNIVERPWVVNGEIVIRPIMYLALSYDHRVIDGKDSVGFLKTVKELLEDPQRMILDL